MSADDSFIRTGDLVFLRAPRGKAAKKPSSSDVVNYYWTGDSASGRIGGVADDVTDGNSEFKKQVLASVLRIQAKHEYVAARELKKYLTELKKKGKSPVDDETYNRLKEREKQEAEDNAEEDRKLLGKQLYYGQVIQLVHYSSNTLLCANKTKRAEMDGTALKIYLTKDASANCYWKIMPQFKVRFEGQKVRAGDQLVLLHLKANLSISLSGSLYPNTTTLEVNVAGSETGWVVDHYAPYTAESEQFLKGSDVIRIFHQDKESFLRHDVEPLYNIPQWTVYFKERNHKHKRPVTRSSNSLWLVELRDVASGGVIHYKEEVRLKHLGTEKYLVIKQQGDSGNHYLDVAVDFTEDGVFQLHPVDSRESTEVRLDEYFRIQHKATGTWLHAGGIIKKPKDTKKKELETVEQVKGARFEIGLSERFNFEDALFPVRVQNTEVDDLNYCNTLHAVLGTFLNKLIGPSRPQYGIMINDTEAVAKCLQRCISFISQFSIDSLPADADAIHRFYMELDAIPHKAHQLLMREQRFVDRVCDILSYYCVDVAPVKSEAEIPPNPWRDEKTRANARNKFTHIMHEQRYLREVSQLCYKFLQLMAKENKKNGAVIKTETGEFQLILDQIHARVQAAECLSELFAANGALLSELPETLLCEFTRFLKIYPGDSNQLHFLSSLCATDTDPVVRSQDIIFAELQKMPEVFYQWKLVEKNGQKEVHVNIGKTPETPDGWIEVSQLTTDLTKKGQWFKDLGDTGLGADNKSPFLMLLDSDMSSHPENRERFAELTKFKRPLPDGTLGWWFAEKWNKQQLPYFRQQLKMLESLVLGGNAKIIAELSNSAPEEEGGKSESASYKPTWEHPFLDADLLWAIIANETVPGSMRSSACNLLFAWFQEHIKLPLAVSVKLTWTTDDVKEADSNELPKLEDAWVAKNLDVIRKFCCDIINRNNSVELHDVEEIAFMRSILNLTEQLVRWGLFPMDTALYGTLVNACRGFVDSRDDTVNWKHDHDTRFAVSDLTFSCQQAKLSCAKMVLNFYDRRLEARMKAELRRYLEEVSKQAPPPADKKPPTKVKPLAPPKEEAAGPSRLTTSQSMTKRGTLNAGVSRASVASQDLIELKTIEKETGVKDWQMSQPDWIPILLDLSLYENDELREVAIRILFRHLRPHHELVTHLGLVDLITDERSIKVYKSVLADVDKIRDMIKDNDVSDDDCSEINPMMKKFAVLCCDQGDLRQPDFKIQRVFRNLKVHEDVIKILSMTFNGKEAMRTLWKTCYLFLKQFCQNNNENQEAIFPHFDLFLSQMGYKLNISEMFDTILHNNKEVAVQVPPSFIRAWIQLLVNVGRKRSYLKALLELMNEKMDQQRLFHNQTLIVQNMMEEDAKLEQKKKILWWYKDLKQHKRTPLKKTDGEPFINVDNAEAGKWTAEAKEAFEKKREKEGRDDDEEDLIYHMHIMELLGRATYGLNHQSEMLCQELVPAQVCYDVLSLPVLEDADPRLKAVYASFFGESWFNTQRPTNLANDERSWQLLSLIMSELRRFKEIESALHRRIPRDRSVEEMVRAYLLMIQHMFGTKAACEVSETRTKIVQQLLGLIRDMQASLAHNTKRLRQIKSILVNVRDWYKQSSVVSEAQKMIADMDNKFGSINKNTVNRGTKDTISMAADAAIDEAKRSQENFQMYVNRLSNKKVEHVPLLKAEFQQVVRLYNKQIEEFKATGEAMRIIKGPDDYAKQLVFLLNKVVDVPIELETLQLDVLDLMLAMIPIVPEKGEGITQEQIEELSDAREDMQTRLAELGLMQAALNLLQSDNTKIVGKALLCLKRLFEGGNTDLQQLLLKFFQSGDATFFSDVRNRLANYTAELKQRRKITRTEEEDEETDTNDKEDFGLRLFQFMQNTCEGHFTEMKNYMREQPDSSRSFNLVIDTATYIRVIQKSLVTTSTTGERKYNKRLLTLLIQLFRTLTEFCSGCSANVKAVVNGKIIAEINQMLHRLLPDTKDLVSFEGSLEKKRGAQWRRRFFVLEDGILNRYDKRNGGLIRSTPVAQMTFRVSDSKKFELEYKTPVTVAGRTTYQIRNLRCRDSKQLTDWLEALIKAGARFDRVGSANWVPPPEIVVILPDDSVPAASPTVNDGKKRELTQEEKEVQQDILVIQRSIVELLISFSEGLLPEQGTIPVMEECQDSLDFEYLQATLQFAWKLSHPKRQPTTELEENIVETAGEVVSATVLFLKILADFEKRRDLDPKPTYVKDILEGGKWSEFAKDEITSIEIVNSEGNLERLYFEKPEECKNLKQQTKDRVVLELNRDSPTDKVEDFLDKIDNVIFEIQHQTRIKENRFLAFLSANEDTWRKILLILTAVLNLLMLVYFHEKPYDPTPSLRDDPVLNIVAYVLGAVHCFFSILMTFSYMYTWTPVIWYTRQKEYLEEHAQENDEGEEPAEPGEDDAAAKVRAETQRVYLQTKLSYYRILWLLQDPWWFYHLLFVVLSGVGVFFTPAFCFHVLDFFVRIPKVINVIKAVTTNYKQLLLTAALALTVIYYFSTLGFFFMQAAYNPDNGLYCDSLFHCFLTTYNMGLRSGGGIGDSLTPYLYTEDRYWGWFFFTSLFHEIVIIILLNMVFGIILNTFGELRDNADEIAEDIASNCPICSVNADIFQKSSPYGFDHHLEEEHNMWNYVYYMLYLSKKDKDEFTAAEEFIAEKKEKGDTAFFPIGKAISITKFKEDKKRI